MHLIIGGAYQGKTDYAMAQFGLTAEDCFICTAETPADFSKKCLSRLEEYALFCLRQGREPADCIPEAWDGVLICRDISCGVVPMDPEVRAWREAVGRMLVQLSLRAETVTRLFCGLPQRLK